MLRVTKPEGNERQRLATQGHQCHAGAPTGVRDWASGLPGRDTKALPAPEGLKGNALKEEQKAVLLELIGAWVHIVPDEAATAKLAALKAKLDDTYFAWYGPTKEGSAVYYRIQGPSLWIEYAPQGGTSHIHTIIRDPANEYGKALIRR